MDKKNIIEFPRKHPVLFNMILILVVFVVLMYGVLCMIDSFTGHGVYVQVPNLRGMTMNEAMGKLKEDGFKWEIVDSAYNDSYKPGVIINQEPKEGSNVKPLRTIYITTNAVSPRTVTIPRVSDMSYRQGYAMLEGLGFKNIIVNRVQSPYEDLILDIKANGETVIPGTKLPINTKIVISVGDGADSVEADSISEDFFELSEEIL